MPRRNSTVKIVDGKVVFSQEIIDYFENLRTVENSEWIDKYFDVLSDEENINAEKFEIHHILPCFTFKDKEHKMRKETQKLADKFNNNLIKLSIYNHLFAHYYLWKIFDNKDSKIAFQRMCGQRINNLTENELKEIAKLKEESAKKNQTKEELKEKHNLWENKNKEKRSNQHKKLYLLNKDEISKKHKNYYYNNKNKISKKHKNYYYEHKDEIKIYRDSRKEESKLYFKKYAEEHKDEKREWYDIYQNQMCIDPIKGDTCILATLKSRKHNHKELYKNVKPTSCVIKSQI